jgi:CsoR family transcriptional regulator, copper-sensing transcriptional repressor
MRKEREQVPTGRAGRQRRLARIEGQVRGIARMLDEERGCEEILPQLAAVEQALRGITRELLAEHARARLAAAASADDPEERERVGGEISKLMLKYAR